MEIVIPTTLAIGCMAICCSCYIKFVVIPKSKEVPPSTENIEKSNTEMKEIHLA